MALKNTIVNILELFAGSRSIGKVAEQLGMKVFSVDIEAFEGIDLVKDIEFVTEVDIPFIPDIVWASPLCTTYSIAAISTHRDRQKPKTELAEKSDRVIQQTLSLIRSYPDCKWFIENPRGMLRKMSFMRHLPRTTVTYCSYGDTRMKPTDIWSNYIYDLFHPIGWRPRPMCWNGHRKCHHERAPRGSKTGTQGLPGDYERSIIPNELCLEILTSVFNNNKK
jgi:hypothetical protein